MTLIKCLFAVLFFLSSQSLQAAPRLVSCQVLNRLPSVLRGELHGGQVLVVAEAGYFAKLRIIKNAMPGDTVRMGYFIFENDYSSSYLVHEMIRQSEKGVKFQIIVDAAMAEPFKTWLGFIGSQKNIDLRLFRGMSNRFRAFLETELKIADLELVWQGLAGQNTKALVQAVMSSPLLMTNIEGIKELIVEAQEPGVNALLLLQQIGSKLALSKSLALVGLGEELNEHLYMVSSRFHHKMILNETPSGLQFVVGGRNLSDEYHMSVGSPLLAGRSYPFFDADIAGVIKTSAEKAQMLESFDHLFLVSEVLKTGALTPEAQTEYLRKVAVFQGQLTTHLANTQNGSVKLPEQIEVSYTENKPNPNFQTVAEKQILKSWLELIKNSGPEIIIPSAYVFFEPLVIDALKQAADQGKTITVYTNSFTSTDMNMVNLAMYLMLPKLRATFGNKLVIRELQKDKGQGSLHAKLFSNGTGVLGVGSANFDPRTNNLDSNNSFFVDLSRHPQVLNQILSRYLNAEDPRGLGLAWFEVTDQHAQALLEAVEKENPRLLKVLALKVAHQQL